MDKLKYVKLENPDGSYSDSIPLSVSAEHVDIASAGGVSNLANYVSANDTNISNLQTTTSSLNNRINSLASGSPLVASSTAEMVDTTRIYVNTSDGYWYYYSGSSWVQGGVYQSTSDAQTIEDEKIGTLKKVYYLNYGKLTKSGDRLVETYTTTRVCTPEISCRFVKNFIFKQNSRLGSTAVYGKDVNGIWQTLNGTTGWGTKTVKGDYLFYIKDNNIDSFRICYQWRADNTMDISPTEKNLVSFTPLSEEDFSLLTRQVLLNDITRCQYNLEYGGVNPSAQELVDNMTRVRTTSIPLLATRYLFMDYDKTTFEIANIVVQESLTSAWQQLNKNSLIWYDDAQTIFTIPAQYNYIRLSFKYIASYDENNFTEDDRLSFTIQPFFINEREPWEENWYENKKYCALGDSITYGFIPRNYAGYPGQLDSYAKLTAEKLGMTFENYGISGSTLAYHASRQPMCVRYTDMPDDADLITVMGGTNDIRNGIELGTMSDRTNTTYYGALHVLLGGLYKKYIIDQGTTVGKNKKIVVLTPIKLLQTSGGTEGGTGTLKDMSAWVDAVKEVAAYYSFPVLDFYNLSGINPHINQTIHGTESGYTGWYNPYITDGTHPTQEGAEMMANVLVGFLKTLK